MSRPQCRASMSGNSIKICDNFVFASHPASTGWWKLQFSNSSNKCQLEARWNIEFPLFSIVHLACGELKFCWWYSHLTPAQLIASLTRQIAVKNEIAAFPHTFFLSITSSPEYENYPTRQRHTGVKVTDFLYGPTKTKNLICAVNWPKLEGSFFFMFFHPTSKSNSPFSDLFSLSALLRPAQHSLLFTSAEYQLQLIHEI